jgi:hypothetical protein
LVQTSVGNAPRRWSNFVCELEMLHTLNLLSSCLNQVSGSWVQKLWILNDTWETVCCSSLSFFSAILYVCITKERSLEVDCNHVQERKYAKAGNTLCCSTCFVLYSKTCTWDANNVVYDVAACKVERGVTNCGREVHTLRARLLLYISGKASMYNMYKC